MGEYVGLKSTPDDARSEEERPLPQTLEPIPDESLPFANTSFPNTTSLAMSEIISTPIPDPESDNDSKDDGNK